MNKIILAAALIVTMQAAAYADNGDDALLPKPARFQPWQRIWQCNDIRVTETMPQPGFIHYDLGGTIWGGSQFALDMRGPNSQMYFNGRPCMLLR